MNRDKLQQQLDEMEAKVAEIEAKVAEMEAELNKPKKFELEYTRGETYIINSFHVGNGCDGDSESCLEHGRYRQTKEAAELSLARNKRANRLEALVEQVGSIKEFALGEENFFVFTNDGHWRISYVCNIHSPEVVYMDKNTAIKVCEILNNGEYTL